VGFNPQGSRNGRSAVVGEEPTGSRNGRLAIVGEEPTGNWNSRRSRKLRNQEFKEQGFKGIRNRNLTKSGV